MALGENSDIEIKAEKSAAELLRERMLAAEKAGEILEIDEAEADVGASAAPSESATNFSESDMRVCRRLKELLDEGVLTAEEFAQKKAMVLALPSSKSTPPAEREKPATRAPVQKRSRASGDEPSPRATSSHLWEGAAVTTTKRPRPRDDGEEEIAAQLRAAIARIDKLEAEVAAIKNPPKSDMVDTGTARKTGFEAYGIRADSIIPLPAYARPGSGSSQSPT